jgi:hypothetical protein
MLPRDARWLNAGAAAQTPSCDGSAKSWSGGGMSGIDGASQRRRRESRNDAMQWASSAVAQGNPLVGKWVSVDPPARTALTLVISGMDGRLQVDGFGKCQPTDCEWGIVDLLPVGASIADRRPADAFATWTHDRLTKHVLIRRDGQQLAVDVITIFKDGSRRSNYRMRFVLRRAS